MTKKDSKATPSKLQEDTAVQEKPAPKKAASEIDEIFAAKKRKKSELGKTGKKPDDGTKRTNDKTKKTNNKKRAKGAGDGEFVDPRPPSRPRKRTSDGLTIYTEDELGINKGDAGSTPLCPFDCSCCF